MDPDYKKREGSKRTRNTDTGPYFSISVLCGFEVPVESVEVLHAELVGANHPESGSQLVTKFVTHLIQPADQAEGQWHKRYVLLKGTGQREQYT
jgi:hypothetical protein